MDRRKLVFFLSLVLGLGVVNYPAVSQWVNQKSQSRTVEQYTQQISAISAEKKREILQQAYEYNEQLAQNHQQLQDGFTAEQKNDARYESLLSLSEDGMMGYINIPAIAVELPIYHGTDSMVLQKGVGHVMQSSLPVGGKNTHAVLSAHTGLADKTLFTDLDQLQVGDRFTLQILDETLTYEVENIVTVLPYETDRLNIQLGRDLVTLVTCTPYGINSHRLLVTGERIVGGAQEDAQPASQEESSRRKGIALRWEEILFGASVLALLAGGILLFRPENKKGGKRSHEQ